MPLVTRELKRSVNDQLCTPGYERLVPGHIRAGCEADTGLVVIAAPVIDDVTAMVRAAVAWNARRRAGFEVALGSFGQWPPMDKGFVSERLIGGSHREIGTAVEQALRDRPDVIVVAGTHNLPPTGALVSAATERLVIAGIVAPTSPRALAALMKDLGPNLKALGSTFRCAGSWRGTGRHFRRNRGE